MAKRKPTVRKYLSRMKSVEDNITFLSKMKNSMTDRT